MNDVDRPVGVEQINHLDDAPAGPTSDHKKFPAAVVSWKAARRVPDDAFDFFRGDAMLSRMIVIPFIPPKVSRPAPRTLL